MAGIPNLPFKCIKCKTYNTVRSKNLLDLVFPSPEKSRYQNRNQRTKSMIFSQIKYCKEKEITMVEGDKVASVML